MAKCCRSKSKSASATPTQVRPFLATATRARLHHALKRPRRRRPVNAERMLLFLHLHYALRRHRWPWPACFGLLHCAPRRLRRLRPKMAELPSQIFPPRRLRRRRPELAFGLPFQIFRRPLQHPQLMQLSALHRSAYLASPRATSAAHGVAASMRARHLPSKIMSRARTFPFVFATAARSLTAIGADDRQQTTRQRRRNIDNRRQADDATSAKRHAPPLREGQ